MAYVIGLTGGIASGKTMASDHLASLGIPVIDSDLIAREVVEPNTPGLSKIREVFGGDVLTSEGRLDRGYLAGLIFKHKPARKILEEITHPLIADEVERRIELFAIDEKILLVAPLMYESGFDRYCDEVWLVRSPKARQIERLMRRDQLTEEEARARLKAQMSDRERATRADVVIENTSDLEDLYTRLEELLRERSLGG